MSYFLVFIGAGLGGVLRYWMSPAVQRLANGSAFPFGTFAVNMLGCLLIGFLGQLAETKGVFQGDTRAFVFIGIIGGYTTFSSFGFETFQLIRDGQIFLALANAAGQVVLGLFLIWVGWVLARLI
ncbi:MAG: fluoride efflux transporter CrcB [Candidatus Obscuribacterales bacterium]|nr:fluoride efflux transporter CrcB [Candidatus Obscuribacterales bacterium]